MNGRLYDPAVGRFLNVDPYVQMPGNTQSYNRYSYCLNNPLRYTDPSGYKWHWKWINPLYWFSEGMQAINDNTTGLRKEMSKLNIPDFQVGMNVNQEGNVNSKGSIEGHEVFNTEKIDRSNAGSVVNKEITQVRQDYKQAWLAGSNGQAWHATSGGVGTASMVFGALGIAGDIVSMSNSTFRITNGVTNGSMVSPKIYSSGWNGEEL